MKRTNRFAILFTVLFVMLTTVISVQAASSEKSDKVYIQVVENVCIEPTLAYNGTAYSAAVFSDVSYSGRYGDQLSGVAKELYDSMVKQYVTDRKTEEYTHTFKKPFTFYAEVMGGYIMTNEALEEIEYEISCATQIAQDAFLYDYPETFWLKVFGTSYAISASLDYEGDYVGKISGIKIIPYENYIGASDDVKEFDAAVKKAVSSITVTDSLYDTLKEVHDYICEKSWYRLSYNGIVYTSAPFFIGDGGMVCEGYAEAFKIICDRLGIPCALIVGYAGESHMWNYVQMEDGKWYLVDATWDDQDEKIYDTYFIANANTIGFDDVAISKERTEDGDFSATGLKCFVYPELSQSEYVIHIHSWNTGYTVDKAPTCTEKGSKSIHCSGCDGKKDVKTVPATNHPNKKEYNEENASCSKVGYTAGVYCKDCNKWLSGHSKIDKLPHTYKTTVLTKATLTANGKTETKCTVCKDVKSSATVYKPTTFTLSTTSYTYDGKEKNPTVTVKDSKGNTLKKGTDYKVTYESGRKNTGRYNVRIDLIGKYSGTKRLSFTIAPKVTSKVATATSTSVVRLTWNKVTGASGYAVFQYKSGAWKRIATITKGDTTTYRVEKLKSGTTYKFKVKAYKSDDGTIWGKATDTITVTTNLSTPKISSTSKSTNAVRLNWDKVTGANGYVVEQYVSGSWKRIATITKADTVTYRAEKLKSGTTYKFRVKAYKKVNGETLWSAASPTVTVKTK